jgi:proteasome accessory factor C
MSTRTSTAGSRDQVNRLLALVPYLRARESVSVDEAAKEFGVKPATIRRDISVLMFCGLPGLGMGDLIEVDFDALEGEDVIRLSNADYLARPLRLDSTEAAALVVGLRALLEGSAEEEREVVQRALRKIEEAAGEAAGVAAHLDVRVAVDADEQATSKLLRDAVAAGRQVRLSHRSPVRDEITTRDVDPIAVSHADGHGYLDAWDHSVEDRRLFRLDRVLDVQLLDAPVSDHAGLQPLDLDEALFRPSPDALLATVRLTAEARWVTEYYPVESAAEEADGGLTITLRVADPAWLVRLLLPLGRTARLVEPADLAEQVRETARRALDQY